jgi:hypothetical protein
MIDALKYGAIEGMVAALDDLIPCFYHRKTTRVLMRIYQES